jgi:hypothetical protein
MVTDEQQQHTLYNFPFRVEQRHTMGNSLLSPQNNLDNLYEPKNKALSLFIP